MSFRALLHTSLPELNLTSSSHIIDSSARQYLFEKDRVNLLITFAYSI